MLDVNFDDDNFVDLNRIHRKFCVIQSIVAFFSAPAGHTLNKRYKRERARKGNRMRPGESDQKIEEEEITMRTA